MKVIESISELQTYLRAVAAKSKHHAKDVQHTVLALVGPVLAYKDPEAPVEVLVLNGDMKNLIATRFGGTRYVFSYGHDSRSVVVKLKTVQGRVVLEFSDDLTAPELTTMIRSLRAKARAA